MNIFLIAGILLLCVVVFIWYLGAKSKTNGGEVMTKKKKKEKKEESLVVTGFKKLGKMIKDSHDSYALQGLIAEATSEDKAIRLGAIAKLKKDFPEIYEEIKGELKQK